MCLNFALAQIDFTPYPGNTTHCPGELELGYTASGTNCGVFTWTITNGKILNSNNEEVTTLTAPSVNVRWDDVAGTGKLKVSATCGGEVKFEEKNFAIRSLTGRVPQNPRANQSLTYCTILPINIAVDIMWLENTGGTTGVSQQRADGYEWVLPAGWSYNGSPGTVRTPQEFINIEPDNGCRGGTVTVKAYMNCGSGRKYSSSASININRVGFSSSLGIPSGYTGPKCGNENPVTFTATNLSCAQSFRWTATGTNWKDATGAVGPWTTATNTLTLYPSGDLSDQGIIAVDINIGCATLTQTYNAVYTNPPLSNPVFTSTSAELICSNSSGPVSVNPVTEAATYSWYITGGTAYINGVLTNSSNPLITTTPNVTVSAPTVRSGYRVSLNVKANRQNAACAGSYVRMRDIWVGGYRFDATYNNGQPAAYMPYPTPLLPVGDPGVPITYNPVCAEAQTYVIIGGNNGTWEKISPFTYIEWWQIYGNDLYFILPTGGTTVRFRLTWDDGCGTTRVEDFYFQSSSCTQGFMATSTDQCLQYLVSPNPASSIVNIAVSNDTPYCDMVEMATEEQNVTIESVSLIDISNGLENHAQRFSGKLKNVELDISKLKKGLYILRISDGKRVEDHRIIIE